MTPKEKAKELFLKHQDILWDGGFTISKPMLKQCALICVEQMEGATLVAATNEEKSIICITYLDEVKIEINKL